MKYIDNIEVEEQQQNIKNMYNDYMTSKSRNLPKDIINKKFDNLRKSMAFLEKMEQKNLISQIKIILKINAKVILIIKLIYKR